MINDILIALTSLISLFAAYVSQNSLQRTMTYEDKRDAQIKALSEQMDKLIKRLDRFERREKRKRGEVIDEGD